jgi:hypothetical protein
VYRYFQGKILPNMIFTARSINDTITQEISVQIKTLQVSVIIESYKGSYPEIITGSLLQNAHPESLHMLASQPPDSRQFPIAWRMVSSC